MKRVWVLVLALSLGLNAGLLFMQISERGRKPRHDGRSPDPERLVERRLHQLNKHVGLNEEQQKVMEEILREIIPHVVAERSKTLELRNSLVLEYASAEMDPNRIRELARKLSTMQVSIDSLATEGLLREAAILTPDQRRRYAEIMPLRHRMEKHPRP